jgi:hypothetical protein
LHTPHGREGDLALELLATGHLNDPRFVPILHHPSSSRAPAAERLLGSAFEKSQDREIQAHACYSLALMLTAREHAAKAVRHRPGKAKKTESAKESEPGDQLSDEIQTLYSRLLKAYREIKSSRKKTYGEIALEALERFRTRTAIDKEQITWHCWFDGGGTSGLVATLYEVKA